jgi:hypothetical protein
VLPDPLLAEYAVYIPTPTIPIRAVPQERPLPDPVPSAIPEAPPAYAEARRAGPTHEARVAAALNRLAERIRGGEIDVSSIAPEGPDAAVVAAVLAALLGGGRSSNR